MSEKHLAVEPSLPQANIAHLARLLEEASLVSLDGEITSARDADNDSLAAWRIAAKRRRDIAGLLVDVAGVELLLRCRQIAGPIDTEFGTARESISRGSVSGVQSERIRSVLEAAAADGIIPWEAVDNVAPLKAHVTPARLAEYAETIGGDLGETLETMLPEKRRVVKLDERSV